MSWRKQLTPEDNEIYLGQKSPIYYAFTILCIIKKRGHCIVKFEEQKSYIFNGMTRTMEAQWKDVSRFVSEGADVKIVTDKHLDAGKREIKVTW